MSSFVRTGIVRRQKRKLLTCMISQKKGELRGGLGGLSPHNGSQFMHQDSRMGRGGVLRKMWTSGVPPRPYTRVREVSLKSNAPF